MDFWTFVVAFFQGIDWTALSSILAGIVLVGGIIATITGAYALADRYLGWWNLLYIPAMVTVTFLIVMFLAWSGLSHAGALT
jgi:hypothetical protein